jgi:hypothetical protein
MSALYISYYTIGNGYEAEAEGLKRTLDAFRLPYQVVGAPMGGPPGAQAWQRAILFKSQFVREMQDAFPDRPLVWLDADARVVQRPKLFDWMTCDLAAHWYRTKELLSGTLFFGPGRSGRSLVDGWIKRNRERPEGRRADQRNLLDVVRSRRDLSVVNLPPEYAWIDASGGTDLSARVYGRRCPVIVHRQASRRLRQG